MSVCPHVLRDRCSRVPREGHKCPPCVNISRGYCCCLQDGNLRVQTVQASRPGSPVPHNVHPIRICCRNRETRPVGSAGPADSFISRSLQELFQTLHELIQREFPSVDSASSAAPKGHMSINWTGLCCSRTAPAQDTGPQNVNPPSQPTFSELCWPRTKTVWYLVS